MIDIGWSEMAVVALIAIVVLGPKELPRAMRAAAKWVRKARVMAREFQSGIDDMIREADLEDARKALDATRDLDVGKIIEKTADPTGSLGEEVRELKDSLGRAEVLDEDAGEFDPRKKILPQAAQGAEPPSPGPAPAADKDAAGGDAEDGAADPVPAEGDQRVNERASNP